MLLFKKKLHFSLIIYPKLNQICHKRLSTWHHLRRFQFVQTLHVLKIKSKTHLNVQNTSDWCIIGAQSLRLTKTVWKFRRVCWSSFLSEKNARNSLKHQKQRVSRMTNTRTLEGTNIISCVSLRNNKKS